jgi:hypothetical protein
MTRRRRAGRPYQPLPRRTNRTAVILIVIVALVLIVGVSVIGTTR